MTSRGACPQWSVPRGSAWSEGERGKIPKCHFSKPIGSEASRLPEAQGPVLMVTSKGHLALSALAPAIGRHAHAWPRTSSFEPCWDNAHPATTRLSTCATRLGGRGTCAKEQVIGVRQSYLWNREGVVEQHAHGGGEKKEIKAQAPSCYVPIIWVLQLLPGTQPRIPIASFLYCHTAIQTQLPWHLK